MAALSQTYLHHLAVLGSKLTAFGMIGLLCTVTLKKDVDIAVGKVKRQSNDRISTAS